MIQVSQRPLRNVPYKGLRGHYYPSVGDPPIPIDLITILGESAVIGHIDAPDAELQDIEFYKTMIAEMAVIYLIDNSEAELQDIDFYLDANLERAYCTVIGWRKVPLSSIELIKPPGHNIHDNLACVYVDPFYQCHFVNRRKVSPNVSEVSYLHELGQTLRVASEKIFYIPFAYGEL